MQSATTGLGLGAGRHSRSHAMRKKKTRVVNLRKPKTSEDSQSESGESMTTESAAAPSSEPAIPTKIPEEPEEDLITPPRSPNNNRVRFRNSQESIDLGDSPRKLSSFTTVTPTRRSEPSVSVNTQSALRNVMDVPAPSIECPPAQPNFSQRRPAYTRSAYPAEKTEAPANPPITYQSAYPETLSGAPGIVEQAWMMKLAGEIARRAHEQKVASGDGFWTSREESPPPAYEQQ